MWMSAVGQGPLCFPFVCVCIWESDRVILFSRLNYHLISFIISSFISKLFLKPLQGDSSFLVKSSLAAVSRACVLCLSDITHLLCSLFAVFLLHQILFDLLYFWLMCVLISHITQHSNPSKQKFKMMYSPVWEKSSHLTMCPSIVCLPY